MPPSLQNLGNIQCENCHGPGSQHAYGLGDTNLITKTVNSGDCNQCHDAPTHHIYGTEWYASRHAQTTGPSSVNCLPLSLGQRLHCPGDCEHQWELCGHCDPQCDFCAH